MGGLRQCFRDDQAPCLHRHGGAGVDGRPDVVMSDAADLVEVHTLRVVKPSDSHSRLRARGLNDSVELHRRVPTSALDLPIQGSRRVLTV